MTFNIIYWDIGVCISNRPVGTSVCRSMCVRERDGGRLEYAHECVLLKPVCVCGGEFAHAAVFKHMNLIFFLLPELKL